ncbi:MAG: hypothetical protein QGI83_08045 [Candidatus Latescibacteria bacterium]|jgi:hypothetical protein|nr:hypothetical protein [Candidatus Latescibacterota bacterium]
MAGIGSQRGWWIAAPILLFFAATGLLWPILDGKVSGPEIQEGALAGSSGYTDSVKVETWNWKRDRSGSIFAVYGTIENRSGRDLAAVTLQLRTEDEAKNTLSTHAIVVARLPAHSRKPFREDVPRTGKEAMGFLDVAKVLP